MAHHNPEFHALIVCLEHAVLVTMYGGLGRLLHVSF